jgi:hypothetical protein
MSSRYYLITLGKAVELGACGANPKPLIVPHRGCPARKLLISASVSATQWAQQRVEQCEEQPTTSMTPLLPPSGCCRQRS